MQIENLTSINASYVHILQKSKVYIIHKDTPFSEKWQNIHGNVIHIANLLTSIEDKNL